MCLGFVFRLITQVIRRLRLSRSEDAGKPAESLILRHQLAVMQRHQARCPNLIWADRALLATLSGVIPKSNHWPESNGHDGRNPATVRLPGAPYPAGDSDLSAKTTSPAAIVSRTRASPIAAVGPPNRFRSRAPRSARLPTPIEPAASKWVAWAGL